MYFRESYTDNSKHIMPDRDRDSISPKEKDSKDYNLAMARYIYSQYVSGRSYITWDLYDSVTEYRSYALGKQSEAKYMETFYGRDDNNTSNTDQAGTRLTRKARRAAYANLNFDIQSPMPRIMDKLVGSLTDLVDRVSVDPKDKFSGAEKENLKWGTYVDGKFREQFNSLRALAALPEMEVGYTPENLEELNLYDAEGGFKLSYATVMEELVKYTFEYSDWEENVLERLIHDITTVGFAAVEDIYEPSTGKTKIGYLDAQYAGVQYTREDGYRRPDYGFYTKMVKMSDLRKMGYKEKDLRDLAEKYSNYFGYTINDDWNKTNKRKYSRYYNQYDEYVVPVFVVKWVDVEYINEKKYNNRNGKTRTRVLKDGEDLKKGDELIQTRVKVLREAHWIIDTEHVYSYGKSEYQNRDGMSEPMLPIHMVKVTGLPIVPRLIPALDLYMNSWMRLQQGISMAAMNGYAIDMEAISNLNMGGQKMSPIEVLRYWRQTGNLFFKRTDIMGRPNAVQSKPIERLEGGAGAVIQESVTTMDLAMRQVEELTGINPVAMGATPLPNQGKAVTEYSLVATNDILKVPLKQLNFLKANAARAVCLRLQHIIKSKKRGVAAYEDVVGETRLELLRIAEGHDIKYGIRTQVRPTQKDIDELKELVALSLKNGRDGKVGITEADAARFNAMINSGESLKRVAMLLHFANKRAQKEAEMRAQRAQQLDQQGAQMLNMQKAEQEARQTQLETVSDIAVENSKTRGNVIEKAVENGELSWQEAMLMLDGVPQQQQQQQAMPQQAEQPVQQGEPIADNEPVI